MGRSDPWLDLAARVEGVLGVPTTPGNRVEVLRNGDAIFPAMLDRIRGAQRAIEFMTFVYWQGDIARRFADALAERARDGLLVRVLLDAYGAHPMDRALIERMRDAGCRVAWLRPLANHRFWTIGARSHRKLLICDGQIGFTGGVGIAEEWEGDARDASQWRDTHFQVRGPAVLGLRAAFLDNWVEAVDDFDAEPHCAPLAPQGDGGPVQVVTSSDRTGWNPAALAFLTLVDQARDRVRIATPYFVPEPLLLERLCAASDRGVQVQVMLPGEQSDSRLARLAGRRTFDRLLAHGVEIWRFLPTMLHLKAVIVDGRVACVGSANLNHRSTRQDDEVCLLLYQPSVVEQLDADYSADLERAERIEDTRWRARSWWSRLAEWFVWRFRRHF